jgi:hypothetical protein
VSGPHPRRVGADAAMHIHGEALFVDAVGVRQPYWRTLYQRARQGGKTALYNGLRARTVRRAWEAEQRPAPAVGPFVVAVGEDHLYFIPPHPLLLSASPEPVFARENEWRHAMLMARWSLLYEQRLAQPVSSRNPITVVLP